MSKERLLPASAGNASVTAMGRLSSLFIVLGISGLLVLAAFLIVHVFGQLNTMSSDLDQVRSSLANLTTMNLKLDKLSSMSQVLRQVDQELTVTNRLLATSNKRLAGMSADSRSAGISMAGMAHTLSLMRGDIHLMSRKLSGSFLFRSVK